MRLGKFLFNFLPTDQNNSFFIASSKWPWPLIIRDLYCQKSSGGSWSCLVADCSKHAHLYPHNDAQTDDAAENSFLWISSLSVKQLFFISNSLQPSQMRCYWLCYLTIYTSLVCRFDVQKYSSVTHCQPLHCLRNKNTIWQIQTQFDKYKHKHNCQRTEPNFNISQVWSLSEKYNYN